MCRLLALPPFQISGADSPNQRGRESACTRVPAARGNGLTTSMPAVPMATSLVVSAKPRLVSLTASASAVAVFRFSSGRVSRRQERSRISSSQYPSRIPDAYASTTHTLKTRKHAQNRTITTQTSGREVERHLTGKATEVSEVICFSGSTRSQLREFRGGATYCDAGFRGVRPLFVALRRPASQRRCPNCRGESNGGSL
jgi:hypothetical protein